MRPPIFWIIVTICGLALFAFVAFRPRRSLRIDRPAGGYSTGDGCPVAGFTPPVMDPPLTGVGSFRFEDAPAKSADTVRPLTEGTVEKGGHNSAPSQIEKRPAAPMPMTRKPRRGKPKTRR